MKKFSCVVFVLLLVSNAFAQEQPSAIFFAGTGLSFPVSQLDYNGYNQNHNVGGGVNGGLSFQILPKFEFRTNISYFRVRFDEQSFSQSTNIQNSGYTVEGGTETFFGLSGELKYVIGNNNHAITPYMIGGGGAYHLTHRNIHFPENGPPTISESHSQWAPTLKGGVGIEFNRLNKIGLYAEINMAASFPEGSETAIHLPLTLGITL